MLKILQINFQKLVFNWKMVLVIFGINLTLGFIFARPFYSTIKSQAKQSLEFEKLTKDFDFTVISDFMNKSGDSLAPFSSLILVLGLVYMLLNTFFAGGILNELKNSDGKFIVGEFLKSASRYFGKFSIILLIELVLITVIIFSIGLFYFIFASIAEGGSEKEYILWMIPPTLILILVISMAINFSDYGKVAIYQNNELSAWDGFWAGVGFTFKHFTKTMGLLFMVLLLALVLFFVYSFISNIIGASSGFAVFLLFLLQQAFVFGRIFLKTLTLGNALTLYESNEVRASSNELRVTSSEASVENSEASEASSEEN